MHPKRYLVKNIAVVVISQSFSIPTLADTGNLPDLGDTSGAIISPVEERKLGENFMRQARRELKFIDDPELLDYLQGLGNRLVSQSDTPQQDFHFYLVDNPAINAFAVPGGFITTHTGLVLAAESEAELASVMAHEIAHISQRHIPRMMAAEKQQALPTLAALLASIVLIGAGEYEGGEAVLALTTAGAAQRQINFTRGHEEEADRVGTQLMAKSGFDPRAMPRFFKRLQQWGRLYETNLPEFLNTHPVTSRRIAESENRAQQYPVKPQRENPAYHHFRAKVRVLASNEPENTIKIFRYNLAQKKYKNEYAERYGYALALAKGKQYEAARKEISLLIKKQPKNVRYRIAGAEIEMSAGNYKRALGTFADIYQQAPLDHSLLRRYGEALLRTKHGSKAQLILKKAVDQQPDDPILYKLLATAAGEAGHKITAHQALAEHYYLSGNPTAAVRQLEMAMGLAADSDYLKASLSARIKEIKTETDRYKEKKEDRSHSEIYKRK